MPNLTSVGVTAGVPTSGTGTVSTLDQVLAQGVPISDGTATNIAAIKAASTAPLATDKALVVAISPNSVNANGQATMANSAPVVIASNQASFPVTIAAGTAYMGNVELLDAAGTNKATIKASSTVPVTATDTAMVVGLRPDSPGIVTLGQTTKSASVPVVLASDQVGTAGTANANVVTVQGIASMTKLLVTPDSVALPANQSVNTAQVNGVTVLTGTGAQGTGSQRVTVSTDTATIAGSAPGTAGSASTNVVTVQGVASMTPIIANQTNLYPTGAVAITASATGTTAATTATLAGTGSKTTYIAGFSIRANATAAATANATVTGTITGTLNFTQWTAPLASNIGVVEQYFYPPIPASATNTGIAVVSAAPGSGGVVSVTAWGFQL